MADRPQAYGFYPDANGINVRYTFDVMPNDDMRLVGQHVWDAVNETWLPDPRFTPDQVFSE